MLLPINTDAPIYHFPWVTISLIVANVAAFVATLAALANADGDAAAVIPWILQFGDGLHPVQWVSSVFMHGGIFHLLGNMFFLWGFGLVVEGKLGWWRYLGLYLLIAVFAGVIEQTLMLGYRGESPGALGASGVIFGMMAMALVWAPKNDMTIFVVLGIHATTFEASILAFCGFYIGVQFLFFALDGFSMGSALLHLVGAMLGLGAGVVLLKRDWVDCENWDLFNVMKGTYGSSARRDEEFHHREAAYAMMRSPSKPTAEEPERPKAESIKATRLDPRQRLARFLEEGDAISASGEYDKLRAFDPMWRPDARTLLALGEGLYKEKVWDEAEPLLRDYLARHAGDDPATAARVRLKLARLLVDVSKRPGEAVALLRQVDPATLPPKAAAAFQDLKRRAEAGRPTKAG